MTRKKDSLAGVEISVNGQKLGSAARKKLLGENNGNDSGDNDNDDDFEHTVNIVGAQLKDGICNYSFEIIEGVGVGATHNVKGPGIVKDTLRNAFSKFHAHMAVIDDAFKIKGIEIDDIDKEHGNELTGLYHVTGFKISGSAENEKIELVGNKYVSSAGGRMELKTPKIPLDNLSSYKWRNELKEAADKARREVERYNNGNYDPIEEEEEDPKPNPKQTSILDNISEGSNQHDESFAEAEL